MTRPSIRSKVLKSFIGNVAGSMSTRAPARSPRAAAKCHLERNRLGWRGHRMSAMEMHPVRVLRLQSAGLDDLHRVLGPNGPRRPSRRGPAALIVRGCLRPVPAAGHAAPAACAAPGGVLEDEDAAEAFAAADAREVGGRQKLGRGAGDEKRRGRAAVGRRLDVRAAVAEPELQTDGCGRSSAFR
jgi:hypothetical protein